MNISETTYLFAEDFYRYKRETEKASVHGRQQFAMRVSAELEIYVYKFKSTPGPEKIIMIINVT